MSNYKKAIRGHATRGKEVIELLERMGGVNYDNLLGIDSMSSYFIDGVGIKRSWYAPGGYEYTTLEKELERLKHDCTNQCTHPNCNCPAPPSYDKNIPTANKENDIINFLLGVGSFDGIWFGDKHPAYTGNFWWKEFIENNYKVIAELRDRLTESNLEIDRLRERIVALQADSREAFLKTLSYTPMPDTLMEVSDYKDFPEPETFERIVIGYYGFGVIAKTARGTDVTVWKYSRHIPIRKTVTESEVAKAFGVEKFEQLNIVKQENTPAIKIDLSRNA
jgi:hypothetical protein